MTISDDLKLYLQERRRALLIEIDGIESLMGLKEVRQNRAERRQQAQREQEFATVDNVEYIRRG